MADFHLKFNDSGKFKILCFADFHMELRNTAKGYDTIALINGALDKLKPDLAVFLGDNIWDWEGMTREALYDSIDALTEPFAQRGIALALVFGNHDSQALLTIEEQLEAFCRYDKCLAVKGECEHGFCNYNLVINNSSDTRGVFNLWFFDSNGRGTGDLEASEERMHWYEGAARALREQNHGYSLPALVFRHIPAPEVYELLKEVPPLTPFCVKASLDGADKYYVISEPRFTTGALGESPGVTKSNCGEFSSWVRTGDVLGAVFGHDHLNDFCGTVDGINLMQTRGSGFYAYGDGLNRGVRLITLDEGDLSTFTTQTLYFKELTDGKRSLSLTGMDTLTRKQKKALRGTLAVGGSAAAASVLGIVTAAIAKKFRKK